MNKATLIKLDKRFGKYKNKFRINLMIRRQLKQLNIKPAGYINNENGN